MSQIDLVYAHIPCPKCGEKLVPLMVWIIPSGYDEDGHSEEICVDSITCAKCGELHDEDGIDEISYEVMSAMYNPNALICAIGNIYSYYESDNEKGAVTSDR